MAASTIGLEGLAHRHVGRLEPVQMLDGVAVLFSAGISKLDSSPQDPYLHQQAQALPILNHVASARGSSRGDGLGHTPSSPDQDIKMGSLIR